MFMNFMNLTSIKNKNFKKQLKNKCVSDFVKMIKDGTLGSK